MLQCLILCIGLFVTASIANVAPFIKPCSKTDTECIKKSAIIALPYISAGIPELGIAGTDPLVAKTIEGNTDGLIFSFKNVIVRGLGKCKFNQINRDPVKQTAFIDIECPIEFAGDYVLSGKLVLLDVEGEGPFKISGDNMHVTMSIKFKQITKGGKKYYKITGFDYTYEPLSKFSFKFENLYNGDRQKAEPVEKLMDQNGKELLSGIGKPVIKELVTRVIENISKFLQKLPTDEIEFD